MDKEEDNIVIKFQKRWQKEGMESTNKNEIIKKIIKEYDKIA